MAQSSSQTLHWSSRQEARTWVRQFQSQLQRPCVVRLSGDVGAGKTQMVKWFLEDLGVSDVMSPTFAIHQEYSVPSAGAVSGSAIIDHVDLYRLNSLSDLESTGFWDLLQSPSGLLFVEWADRLPDDMWPKHWRNIKIHLQSSPVGAEVRDVQLVIQL